MIQSSRKLESAEIVALATRSDVCIIGAGPAGLSLAIALDDLGARVLVLDSGPVGGRRAAEALSVGTNEGFLTFPLHEMRKRGLGGTSRAWASNLARLEPEDFEAKEWIPHSGWPITAGDLDPFLDSALLRFGLTRTVVEHQKVEAEWRNNPLFRSGSLDVRAITASNAGNVGRRWKGRLESSKELHVLTDTHVTRLVGSSSGDSVQHLEVIAASTRLVSHR